MKLLLLLTFGVIATLANEAELLQQFSVGNHQFTADVYKVRNPNSILDVCTYHKCIISLVFPHSDLCDRGIFPPE